MKDFFQERAEKIKAQELRIPAVTEACNDLRVLVDPRTRLPENYVPRDLVSLRLHGISTLTTDMLLRQETAEHLAQLVAAASAASEELVVASAYRSFQDQKAIFTTCAAIYGDEARRVCALPGHSQHQLGTAVDFADGAASYRLWYLKDASYPASKENLLSTAMSNGAPNGVIEQLRSLAVEQFSGPEDVMGPFADTKASQWLLKHAEEYGFVLAYPKDGEAETGYYWEPWHYRYIGVDNVQRLQSSGLSLQVFLLQEGVLPPVIDLKTEMC